jgi:hypothetical protein
MLRERLHRSAMVAPVPAMMPRERKRKTAGQLFCVEVGLELVIGLEVAVGTAASVGVGIGVGFDIGVGEGMGVGDGAGEGVGATATDPASVA